MCDKAEFEVCRLCLNNRGLLMNVFCENSNLQFMLEKTIEDLIDVKVVEDANYPWLVCSNCMEKLTEFRLFKRRCAECLFVFHNRIQRGCNPATKDCITNRKEFADEINKEFCDDPTVSGAIDKRAVDVPDDMINVKVEIDTISECSASPVKDIESLMVASMQDGCSHWSVNEEPGNLANSQDGESRPLPFNEKVVIKEEWDVNVPREGGGQGADLSQEQDDGQGEDGTGKEGDQRQDGAGNGEGHLLHGCQICKKVFKERELLNAHIRRVHLEKGKQFRYDVCSDAFECKSDLHEHVKVVHAVRREYRCQQCSRHFQNINELRIHLSTHTSERSYKCEVCWKAFKEKVNLRKHILTHKSEKPHKCEMCPKAFSLKGDLKRHIGTHTGKKQYKCQLCSKAFVQNGALQRHMSTHTGEKQYKCEVCSKTFSQIGNLKRHMWTHTDEKQYKCMICSKEFSRKHYLESHSLSHSEKMEYKCAICSKEFKRKSDLSRHKKQHTAEITA